jgi:hypothetical protein
MSGSLVQHLNVRKWSDAAIATALPLNVRYQVVSGRLA